MKCVDCDAAGIEAAATRIVNGKGYCSSHARKYFPMVAAVPPENPQIAQTAQKGDERMDMKHYDKEALVREYQAGTSVTALSEKFGIHHTTVRSLLKARGVYAAGRPQKYKPRMFVSEKAGSAPENVALVRSQAMPAPAVAQPGSAGANGNGHARCRVAMFEVEGDATAIQHAVDAIKAALESRI